MNDLSTIAALRQQIRAIERSEASGNGGRLTFGIPAIDRHLPDHGLRSGAVHEVIGDVDDMARIGLIAALLGRMDRPVFWLRAPESFGQLSAGGLSQFGLQPHQLVLSIPGGKESLWALEEAARCQAFAAVVGEGVIATPVQGRRLQLASETGGTLLLLLPPASSNPPPSLSATRWRVTSAPGRYDGGGVGPPRWAVSLLRCRSGTPGSWLLEWDDEELRLGLVADMANRPLVQVTS
ncbi:hypothetical protein [Azospirillum sp. SYSU D00513]|uniref:ImuA family protein n=1 Tax=Azospirillum sp. SYSU D00513 TaxID=2812561 RepID=UPI001A967176|nr:hypothetical protein [Azospirillum sp. SYSU D00513]